jgi:YebC/PmpR family DNA-binding regulatory protein
MAGHSKWANIKRRKAKMDAQRSNIISKAMREILLSARQGGGNPETNFRLKVAIERAKNANVPVDSINRTIKRGTGEIAGGQIEELVYEGYGPKGTAVLVEASTDNRNRTVSDIRHIFSKHGGKLAESGSVAWMFEQKGLIIVEKSGVKEEDVLAAAIDGGALDFKDEDEVYEIYTAPGDLEKVKQYVEAQNLIVSDAELVMIPNSTIKLEENDAAKMLKLLDALDEHDDVSKVYSNFDIPDEFIENQ